MPDTDTDFFTLFKSRWKLATEAEAEQRQNEIDDLEFEAGSHWDPKIKKDREDAGIPCLTIDLLSGPIKLVTNQQRTARPGIQISPVGEAADEKKATRWQGLIRRVERLSQAGRVYSWAGQSQVRMGRGFWVVRNIEVGDDGEQDIRLEEVDNQHTIYCDPTTKKLDTSDKRWAIRFQDLTHEEYRDRFGESALSNSYDGKAFQGIGDAPPEWITAKHCRIAEYYYIEDEKTTRHVGARTITKTRKRVHWCLIDGMGEKLDSTIIPGEYIPVVMVFGERRNINGKVDYRGMVRMAKDPARMEDWAESSLMEAISDAKTAPWLAEFSQLEGLEATWNLRKPKVLVYHNKSGANGSPLPPPQRVSSGVDVSALTMAAQRMQNHVRNVTGVADLFQEETASQQANASGRAIMARKQNQELGTSDYLENLGDGIVLTAKIIMSMAREVYDTPRVMRIVGDDEKVHSIVTHMGAEQAQAATQMMSQEIQEMFDLSGHPEDYDIAIAPGKNYQTARQEAVEAVTSAITAFPPIAPKALPILFKNSDWAGAQELAAALAPPEDGQPDPAQLQAENQQLKQQLQEAAQIIQTDQVKQQATIEKARIDAGVTMETQKMANDHAIVLQQMKDATTLAVAKLNALTKGVIAEGQAEDEAMAVQEQRTFETDQAERGRLHEAAMAAAQHQRGMEQGDADAGNQAMLAEQGQGHALEQGDMGHAQALEQQNAAGQQKLREIKATPRPQPGAKA